jgi:hypothetical protein
MKEHHSTPSCCCNKQNKNIVPEKKSNKLTEIAKTLPSILLSIVIALFPKCPLCWAAYMSLFSSIGLSQLPYKSWLFPVLLGFMALHLFLLIKKVATKGYGPLVLNIIGIIIILLGRFFFFSYKEISFMGLLFIIVGSLWNNINYNYKIEQLFTLLGTRNKRKITNEGNML